MKIIYALVLIVLLAGCKPVEEAAPVDERCEWKPGRCLALGSGYHYVKSTNSCEHIEGKICEDAPFPTKEACEEVCKK